MDNYEYAFVFTPLQPFFFQVTFEKRLFVLQMGLFCSPCGEKKMEKKTAVSVASSFPCGWRPRYLGFAVRTTATSMDSKADT